ncbi:MAG: metallophosphoesterase family protein, partial [Bryobacteraceae bacterium]
LIPTTAVWRYLDNGTNQGTAWRATAFNDAAWKTGPAQLGYGDGDEATVVSYGNNANKKHITTYFRHAFSVSNPAAIGGLQLRLLRDDGAIVYLNGTEVFRSNMPAGNINFNTVAGTSVEGAAESTFYTQTVSPSLLATGTNVIAVEVHQVTKNSADLSFNLELKTQ